MEKRGVAERALAFMKGMQALDTLEALTNLACTLLGNPLLLCDALGNIQALAPAQLPDCAAWPDLSRTRRLDEQRLAEARANKTALWPGGGAGAPPCAYLALPLVMDEINPPGALLVVGWLKEISNEDIQLAQVIAGTLGVLIRRKFGCACMAQTARIQLLRELLGYKPGLHSYFERGIAIEKLDELPGLFRVVYIHLGEDAAGQADRHVGLIRGHLDGAWTFGQEGHLVCVFNEALVRPLDFEAALSAFLRENQFTGCLSTAFRQLIHLRRAYELARSAWQIAARQGEAGPLIHAENYQTLAFLFKCQRYFPIAEYCPDGLLRLIEHDAQTGRDYRQTLSAYLDNNLNANQTAKQLFLHRNTLTQRLEKIEEILGMSLKDREVCLYLQLSLRILQITSA